MRALWIYAIAASLLLSSCVMSDNQEKRYDRIARLIFDAAHEDITRINEIMYEIMYIEELVSADEERREELTETYFRGSEVTFNGETIRIVSHTTYGTQFTTTIVTNGLSLAEQGTWSVTRTGGDYFNVVLSPFMNKIKAEFNKISHIESSGTASLLVSFDQENYSFSYDGHIELIDNDRSIEQPLTLLTEITSPLQCYGVNIIAEGHITITAYDDYYDTTDIVKAHYMDSERMVALRYLDWQGSTKY